MLAAAPLLPVALSAAAQAQQAEQPAPTFSLPPAGSTPAPNPNRQGPEIDVYRDSPTPSAMPPAVTPTITPPPVAVQPAPTPQPAPARSAPERPSTTAPVERPAATPAPEAATNQSGAAPESPPANAAEPASVAPQPAPESAPQASVLPWIIGGVLVLLALVGLLLLRRRRTVEQPRPGPIADPVTEASAPPPPPPAPPQPPPPPPTSLPESAVERPWLDMDMALTQARFSLLGVTIAYSLMLHNRGDRPAQDILVRGLIGNAGAQQQALLQRFFGGDDGMPLHHSVAIEPGETRVLTGELRLAADAIQPVQMGQRSLLIPIAAFDAAYRWGGEGDDPAGQNPAGQGRTARAFIVGQEQEPPTDRLAPLRLDQGPRQYRRPAARAAVELTPA